MRVRCGLIVALLALAACGSSSGQTLGGRRRRPASASPAACGPSARADACRRPRGARLPVGRQCLRLLGRGTQRYRLGAGARSIREGRAGPIALAGRDVAYGFTTDSGSTRSRRPVVVRRPQRRQAAPQRAGDDASRCGPESFQSVALDRGQARRRRGVDRRGRLGDLGQPQRRRGRQGATRTGWRCSTRAAASQTGSLRLHGLDADLAARRPRRARRRLT